MFEFVSLSESPEVVYRPLSGNRTIIIGSTRLHCDPPPGYDFDTPERTNEQGTSSCDESPLEKREITKLIVATRLFSIEICLRFADAPLLAFLECFRPL